MAGKARTLRLPASFQTSIGGEQSYKQEREQNAREQALRRDHSTAWCPSSTRAARKQAPTRAEQVDLGGDSSAGSPSSKHPQIVD